MQADDQTLLLAIVVAETKHYGQTRKYTGEPYTNHLKEVADYVSECTHDLNMICAAWLHDTLEDTDATETQLRALFGDVIVDYVIGLTDVSKLSDGNRALRKKIDAEHMWKQPTEVQIIKCADIISNTKSITEYDPDFARVYLREKQRLLDGMNEETKKHPLFKLATSHIGEYEQ